MRSLSMVVMLVVGLLAGPASAKHKRKPKKPPAPMVSMACTNDADCALTKFADGECCPMLCQPRVMAKESVEALAKYGADCKQKCPSPSCPPPQQFRVPACEAGKCVLKASSLRD